MCLLTYKKSSVQLKNIRFSFRLVTFEAETCVVSSDKTPHLKRIQIPP